MRVMRIERFDEPARFFAHVGEFLARHEAEHNLILGFREPLERDAHAYGDEDPYLVAVHLEGEVVAAAARTPPHNLVLSRAFDEAVDAVLADLLASGTELPGVGGPVAAAERFARGWARATGATARLAMAERAYEATEVQPPPSVPGRMRTYGAADRATAIAWMDAFFAEALPGGAEAEGEAFVVHRLSTPGGGLVFWDDDGPVSLAGFTGPTPTGIRIGPVYTPPPLRGRGYGSALTAALTEELLAGGRRACFLFTDLSNPTSNSIYQRIGYRVVADVSRWAFDPA
jgi:predicted GNAT family acetyltransferase